MGYAEAGFEVIGVDIEPQPNYPFEFIHGGALTVIPWLCERYDVAVIHTSPPCQDNIAITAGNRARDGWTDEHVNHIPQTRAMLAKLRDRYGTLTIIENGVTRRLRRDLMLCGLTFNLPTFRHRYFELDGFTIEQPEHVSHKGYRTDGWRHGIKYEGNVYGVYGSGGGKPTIGQAQMALGIYHTDVRRELNEAVPPAYTRYIGEALMTSIKATQ